MLIKRTGNAKGVPVHTMKAYGGWGVGRGIASLIINVGTRWRWVVNVTPRPL